MEPTSFLGASGHMSIVRSGSDAISARLTADQSPAYSSLKDRQIGGLSFARWQASNAREWPPRARCSDLQIGGPLCADRRVAGGGSASPVV